MKPGVLRIVLPTIAATLTCLNNSIAQAPSFKYGVEYMCGKERVVVYYCRNDSGQPVHESQNYCAVEYLDRPRRAPNIPVSASELRSEMETKLRACSPPGAQPGGSAAGTTAANPATSANQAMTKAQAFMAARNYAGAMDELKAALRLEPRNAAAFHMVGVAQYNLKDYTVANAAFERALQLNVTNPHFAWRWIGDCQRNLNQPDKAIAAYREAARLKPDFADPINGIGIVYYGKDDFANALIFFEQAARIAPKEGTYRKNAAFANVRLGRKADAMRDYNLLLAFDQAKAKEVLDEINKPVAAAVRPRTPADDKFDEGGKLYEAKDYKGALAKYDEAVKLQPGFGKALHYQAMARFMLKQYSEAIAGFQAAIKAGFENSHFSYTWLGDAYFELKQYENALTAFREAIKLGPDQAGLHARAGGALFSLQRYQEAVPMYLEALRRKPDDINSMINLADVYVFLGKKADATAMHQKVLPLDKERAANLLVRINTPAAVRAANGAAEGFLKAGHKLVDAKEYTKALAEYQKAVAANPDNIWLAGAHLGLGETYSYLRDYDRSIANLLIAARLDPTYGRVYESLGYSYKQALQFPKAVAAYKEAIRLEPEEAGKIKLQGYLATTYALMGDRVEAMKIHEILKTADPVAAKALLNEIAIGDEEGPAGILVSYGSGVELMGGADDVALEYYRNAAKLKATKHSVHFDAASGLNRYDKSAEAMALLQQILARRPVGEDLAATHFHIGQTYSFMKEYAKAIPEIRKAQQIKADSQYSYWLGSSYSGLKQYPEALAAFQDALKLEPDYTSAIARIADTYVDMGQPDKAVAYLVEQTSDPAKTPTILYQELGELYSSLKRYPESVTAYKSAIARNPSSRYANYELGLVYVAMRRKQDAMAVYRVLRPLDNNLAQKLLAEINKP